MVISSLRCVMRRDLKAEHLKNAGDGQLGLGNFKSAWCRYTEALALAQDRQITQRLLCNRSLAFCKAGRFQQAVEDADIAIQACGRWDKAWFRRGSALVGLQQMPEAVAAFRQALNLSKGEAGCRRALWITLQRLTWEQLGSTILDLLAELEAQGAIPVARAEVATRVELKEACYMHLKAARKGGKSQSCQPHQEVLTWLTDGMPAATGLHRRSCIYANAKCFQQAAADACAAIALLEVGSQPGCPAAAQEVNAKEVNALSAAYQALGEALLAEKDHPHEDCAGAFKALLMAVEYKPENEPLCEKLHAAEEKLSSAQRTQVQQELYDSGRSSQAGRLLQGMLGAPECGLRLFKVSVAVWLPQAAVKAVSASRRACLRSAFAAAAGVKDVHVQLDSVRQSTLRPSKTYDAPISKPRHLQEAGALEAPNNKLSDPALAPSDSPAEGAGVSICMTVHIGADHGKAKRLTAMLQARRVLSVEILEAFPDACATGHIVDITPAAYAQGSSDIASIAAHQELQSDAIAPVRPPTQLALPYGAYRLVHSDGSPVERTDKHPFCMSRVYYEAVERPSEVWAELADGSCRWRQTSSEVKVIALQVPEHVHARELLVTLQPYLVRVARASTGEVYLEGRLERGIAPHESLWVHGKGAGEDGFLLLLRKMNLELLCKHWLHSEMWWTRLFQHHDQIAWDDYEKDYSDLPRDILQQHNVLEAQRDAIRQVEASEKAMREILEERNDARKRARQARLTWLRAQI